MKRFVAALGLTTAGCLFPSLDSMSGGAPEPPRDAGVDAPIPTPEDLPPVGPALRVDDSVDGLTRAWIDGQLGVDFSRATGWQPSGFYDAVSGTELRGMPKAWLEVVNANYCLTTTGSCSPTSVIDGKPTPAATVSLVHDDVHATLASAYARPSFDADIRVSFELTLFVNGRLHVHVHVEANPTISVSPDLQYGNLRLATPAATWQPFPIAPAIAIEDPAQERAILATPKSLGYGQTTTLDSTSGSTGFRETKRDVRSGVDREYDVLVLGPAAAQTTADAMAARKFSVDGDARQTGASPESTFGFFDVTASANARRIVLRSSSTSPAFRISGWTSPAYTVRVGGEIAAASTRPSTTAAVAFLDRAASVLEIALRGPLEANQSLEITSDEPRP